MILKSITLESIRSYGQPTTVDFQLGTTLLEGDVASGKSTILSAVEFALFGLGDLNGSFLLRNGAESGRVTLEFEVDEKTYRVQRSLVRRGESVRSGDSYIEEEGEKEKYATRELKEKILQLLRFNEPPNPKAQSVIYRYAIFTPQEAMRDIIERDSDTRLETLRKAYGIEQYRTAAQNTDSVSREFRGRIGGLKIKTRELDEDRKQLAEVRARKEALESDLAQRKGSEKALKEQLERKRLEREELEARKAEMGRAQDMIPSLTAQLRDKDERKKAALREAELSKKRFSGLENDVLRLESTKNPATKSEEELGKELRSLDHQIEMQKALASRLGERLDNFNEILEKGVCPICEREYEADRVGERKKHIQSEVDAVSLQVRTLDVERGGLTETIEGLGEFLKAQRELKLVTESAKDWKDRATESEKAAEKLEVEIGQLNERIREATKAAEPIRKIETEISKLADDLRRLQREHDSVLQRLGGILKEIESTQADVERLSGEITEKEGLLKLQGSLEEGRMWLTDYFAPTVQLIEKHALANRNHRFQEQFQKWFQVLVDDPDLKVRVQEDFSPVIEREGYEQDYRQLSGGERTSVALAYRLALNTTVQEAALGQEPNLLILDEPTDGFSKEQLGKFGDILDELRCPQVILVSHERELENLADQVYKIEKVNGESMVTTAQLHQK